jgi:DNA polymerase-3 subunit alpha
VAYALLSYQTAWLKRHYPAEFMAALLSSVVDKTDDVVHYIAECRDLGRYIPGHEEGIEVLAPDVNESERKFTPVSDTQIRFGLGALRGLGTSAVNAIIHARRTEGSFTTIFELADRVELRTVGKRALEALVLAGACDALTDRSGGGAGNRARLAAGLETVVREAQLRQEERSSGQASLFDLGGADAGLPERPEPQLPDVAPWPESERLAREKEVLGFFISGHPLDRYRDEVRAFGQVTTTALQEYRDQKVELACVVTAVSRQISKRNGAAWGRLTVEDYHGTATVLAFGDVWEEHRERLVQDAPVLLRGSVSGRDRDEDDPPIFLDDVIALEELRGSGLFAVELMLGPEADPEVLERATSALQESPGDSPLLVRWRNGGGRKGAVRMRSRTLRVRPDEALMGTLRDLFGRDGIRLVRTRPDS